MGSAREVHGVGEVALRQRGSASSFNLKPFLMCCCSLSCLGISQRNTAAAKFQLRLGSTMFLIFFFFCFLLFLLWTFETHEGRLTGKKKIHANWLAAYYLITKLLHN